MTRTTSSSPNPMASSRASTRLIPSNAPARQPLGRLAAAPAPAAAPPARDRWSVMKLKQRPEDFQVTESWRFDDDPRGGHFVYLMDKQKLSTFEAVDRICARFKIPRASRELLRAQGQAGAHDPARRDPAARDRAAGAGPAPEAPRPDARAALGGEHHLEPVRGDGPRPLRGGRRAAPRLDRRGAPARRRELLRLAAVRLAEARPGLHREGPHARRVRGRAPERARPAVRARPVRRRAREGVLEGALGRVGPPQPVPRRGAVRGGREVAAHATRPTTAARSSAPSRAGGRSRCSRTRAGSGTRA